jgi:hypothetical protein
MRGSSVLRWLGDFKCPQVLDQRDPRAPSSSASKRKRWDCGQSWSYPNRQECSDLRVEHPRVTTDPRPGLEGPCPSVLWVQRIIAGGGERARRNSSGLWVQNCETIGYVYRLLDHPGELGVGEDAVREVQARRAATASSRSAGSSWRPRPSAGSSRSSRRSRTRRATAPPAATALSTPPTLSRPAPEAGVDVGGAAVLGGQT